MEKTHSEELHNLYSSQNIIRAMNSRRTRSARLVTRKEEMKMLTKFNRRN